MMALIKTTVYEGLNSSKGRLRLTCEKFTKIIHHWCGIHVLLSSLDVTKKADYGLTAKWGGGFELSEQTVHEPDICVLYFYRVQFICADACISEDQ